MPDSPKPFVGSSAYAMDDKFRVTIPKDFHESLKSGFVLTCGPNGSLILFRKEDWDALEASLTQLPIGVLDRGAALMARTLLGGKHPAALDSMGKLAIPQVQRDWAQVKHGTSVYVMGAGRTIEIWRDADWMAHCRDASTSDAWYAAVESLSSVTAKAA